MIAVWLIAGIRRVGPLVVVGVMILSLSIVLLLARMTGYVGGCGCIGSSMSSSVESALLRNGAMLAGVGGIVVLLNRNNIVKGDLSSKYCHWLVGCHLVQASYFAYRQSLRYNLEMKTKCARRSVKYMVRWSKLDTSIAMRVRAVVRLLIVSRVGLQQIAVALASLARRDLIPTPVHLLPLVVLSSRIMNGIVS